ncbi:hypothetical protein C7E12_22030, partial [Stenotrophomonas maltophilia]
DAGLRELWHTGYMHNRVRMIVASYLCKHLRAHWHDWQRGNTGVPIVGCRTARAVAHRLHA